MYQDVIVVNAARTTEANRSFTLVQLWRLPQGKESGVLISVDRLGWAVEQGCVGTGSAAFFVFCDPAVELVALL